MSAVGMDDRPALPPDASPEDEEREKQRVAAIEQGLREAGQPIEEPQAVDYFDFADTDKVPLPDGVQWVEIKALNEGERKRYQNQTNSQVGVSRATGDMNIKTKPGDDRHLLLSMAITGFYILKAGVELPFTPQNVGVVLDKFPPKVIDLIDKAVHQKNPWLMADLSLEDLVKQRDELNDLIATKEREEAGKAS